MNDNQKWVEQIKTVSKTKRARLILGLWIVFISVPITIFLGAGMGVISLAIYFTILWLFPYWQPAYLLMYMISGNKDISPILEEHELKSYHYLIIGVKTIFLLFLFYAGIKSIMEKGICGINPFC